MTPENQRTHRAESPDVAVSREEDLTHPDAHRSPAFETRVTRALDAAVGRWLPQDDARCRLGEVSSSPPSDTRTRVRSPTKRVIERSPLVKERQG